MSILLESNIAGLEAAGERVRVKFGGGAVPPLEVDRVIYALGGTTPQNFLKSVGIAFDGPSPRLTDSCETNVPGLYLAGDLTAAAAMRRIRRTSRLHA